ncbi:flagellar filament capping protein FliD [Alphaproteobacteria bacterium]|nr:flagellar filament capping protein FliD [Alphaproteobacteria bacterium]
MTVDYLSIINQGGSGLNITQIVDSLVEAEKIPQENAIQKKIDEKTTSISAIGEVKSTLSKLSTSLNTLVGKTSLAVSSNSTSVTATISDPSKAKTLNSSITISALAAGQTLAFTGYSDTTSIVGTGSLTLERGDWSSGSFVASATTSSKTLSVSSTDTLASLRDNINALDYGVTASIVGIGDGSYNLVLKSGEGKENALRITATESPSGSGLSNIDNTTTNGSKQKIAGTDATIVVDGMTLKRSSNIITDLFEGYNVNLVSTTSTTANITSSVDENLATTNLENLVSAINTAKEVLNSKTFRGDASNEAGELSSDPVINNLKKQIDSLVRSPLAGFGANSLYLSNLGIRTQKDGTLSLNTTILKNELKNNPTTMDAIFNSMYSSSSGLLTVSGGTNRAPEPGSYTFAMTAYVSGAITGLASSDTTPGITASNNTIQITVDGTTSGTITVPSAEYSSEAALATAIQTAINSDTVMQAVGKTVVVTHTNGSYSIKSGTIGALSSVSLNSVGSNLDSFLKFAGATDSDGLGTAQSGTASTALTLNGALVTSTDSDGLVDNETLGSSGNFTLDGGQTSSNSATNLNSFVTIASSNNLSSVTFTITGTDIDGNAQQETITGPTAGNSVTGTKIFQNITQISSNASAAGVNIGTKSAFVDTNGKRPSITSEGSDESGKTFVVSGTDMSGNVQTETITGPGANATVLGSKTFKTITSITPSANTAGNITLGMTGVLITTTGVNGSATLGGEAMVADISNNTFSITSGSAAGLKVKYDGLGANGTVFYGQSLLNKLTSYISTSLTSTEDGSVASRITKLNNEVSSENTLLSELNTKFENTRSRYLQQFTIMEQAVTSLKSTGEYLTNLFEAMNQDD